MTLAWRLLGALAIAAGLIAAGYRWGSKAESDARDAQQLQVERAATAKLVREVDRGNVAQAELGQALEAQHTSFSDLERAFDAVRKHSPLVVYRATPGGGLGAGGDGTPNAVVPGATTTGAQPPTPGCDRVLLDDAGPGDLGLTAGAVWMWNSALAGADQPAGACGLADTSEGACAAATSLTTDDAWANHTENARLCAEDRTRHNHLIDFITQGRKQ